MCPPSLNLLPYPNYRNVQIDCALADFLSFFPAFAGAELRSGGNLNFFAWYYFTGFLQVAKVGLSVIILTIENFSLLELSRTLLYPWRRDVIRPLNPTLQIIFQVIALNLASRFFGFIVRFFTLLAGLIILATVLVLVMVGIAIFAVLPISLPIFILATILLISHNPLSIWGYLILLASAGIMHATWLIYKKGFIENPPLPETLVSALARLHREEAVNLAPFLTFEARRVFSQCNNLAVLRKHLLSSTKARFIFSRAEINLTSLPTDSSQAIRAQEFLLKAGEFAVVEKHSQIEIGDLILALACFDSNLQAYLTKNGLNINDLQDIVFWQTNLWKRIYPPSPLLDPSQIKTTGGLAKDWASGYTPFMDEYSSDLTDLVDRQDMDMVFQAHQDVIQKIETILARNGRHNVLLLGAPGVGKRNTILGFSREVLIGKTLRTLAHKRVVELDINRVLAGPQGPGALEERLVKIFSQAMNAGNVIIFIDQIERLLASRAGEAGAVNASQVLVPFLSSNRLQLVATTSPGAYHHFTINHPELADAFEKIEVAEPSAQQILRVLEEIATEMEIRYNAIITFNAIREIIRQGDRLIPNKNFPQKGIDLMDEIGAYCQSSGLKIVTREIVDQYLSKKTKVPIGATEENQKAMLMSLEKILHQEIINQDNAVTQVSSSLRRASSGVSRQNRPMGNFLFLGPTGVGKTALAKALAKSFFGSAKNMLRFDMSEYQEIGDIERLIGSQGAGAPGLLTSKIAENPYTLVLFDEIEKANKNILNLFLQLLDEGELTDSFGQKASFRNALIIGTSNADSNFIRNAIKVGKKMEEIQKDLLNEIQNQGIFAPEFLNRFDGVIAFRSLTLDELKEVVKIQIKDLNQRLADKNIVTQLTDGAMAKMALIGQDVEYGARALERAIADKIENMLANLILTNKISRGQTLVIDEEMIK